MLQARSKRAHNRTIEVFNTLLQNTTLLVTGWKLNNNNYMTWEIYTLDINHESLIE